MGLARLWDRVIGRLDYLGHKHVSDGTWLARVLCDAYDLRVGMETEDFGAHTPSLISYWIAGRRK